MRHASKITTSLRQTYGMIGMVHFSERYSELLTSELCTSTCIIIPLANCGILINLDIPTRDQLDERHNCSHVTFKWFLSSVAIICDTSIHLEHIICTYYALLSSTGDKGILLPSMILPCLDILCLVSGWGISVIARRIGCDWYRLSKHCFTGDLMLERHKINETG